MKGAIQIKFLIVLINDTMKKQKQKFVLNPYYFQPWCVSSLDDSLFGPYRM